MKTVTCNEYGPPNVLKIGVSRRPNPGNRDILVRVYASSVTAADTMIRKGEPIYGRLFLGLFKPKFNTPGTGFSGVIEELGNQVENHQVGDQVFGEVLFTSDNLTLGTNAEYVCVPEDQLVFHKPNNVSHIEAACICDGLVTSLNFLKHVVQLKSGQSILINGASGSLGTAAVQIAKVIGAKVTAVCSDRNRELVKSLGADIVLDYTQEHFEHSLKQYDVIYDSVGKLSFIKCQKHLTEHGAFISPVLSIGLLANVLRTSLVGNRKARFSATGLLERAERYQLFKHAIGLLAEEKVRQVVDRTYLIDEIKAAHGYVETGRKVGNLALIPSL